MPTKSIHTHSPNPLTCHCNIFSLLVVVMVVVCFLETFTRCKKNLRYFRYSLLVNHPAHSCPPFNRSSVHLDDGRTIGRKDGRLADWLIHIENSIPLDRHSDSAMSHICFVCSSFSNSALQNAYHSFNSGMLLPFATAVCVCHYGMWLNFIYRFKNW